MAMKEEERESVPIKTCKIAFEAFKGINGKMCGRPIVKGKKCHGGKLKVYIYTFSPLALYMEGVKGEGNSHHGYVRNKTSGLASKQRDNKVLK